MVNFEEHVELTGWGFFHQFLLGLASACAFAQATGQMSIPFAIPIAACDIPMKETAILNVNVFLSFGMAIGGFILSSTSDVTGRKCMIPTTLILIFSSNFACGFSHGYTMVSVCVFILGSGLSSNANCVKIHLAESMPSTKRGSSLVLPDIIWSIGYILFSILCWLITPVIIKNRTLDMRLATWRLIFGLSGALSIMIACASALLLPSPRFLLYNKKFPEALDVLKHMYAINNSRHCETFSLHEDNLNNVINTFNLNNDPEPTTCIEYIFHILKYIKKATSIILSKRFLWLTAIIVLIKITMLFGILMINIWLSKMLHFGEEKDCYLTGVHVLHLEERQEKSKCNFTISSEAYKDFFLIAVSILVGQFVLMLTIEKIGRRIPVICGCIICGVSSISLAYIENFYIVRLALSSLFMAFYSITESALNVAVIESYPTAIRGTAAGETQFFAYIACGLLKKYLQTPCQYSFIFVGAIIFGATGLAYFLPDYTGQPMVE